MQRIKTVKKYLKSALNHSFKFVKAFVKGVSKLSAVLFGKAVKLGKISCRFLKNTSVLVFLAIYNNLKAMATKSSRVFAGLVAVAVLTASATSVALATNATVAYDVFVEDKKIATIKDQTVLAEAEILAVEIIDNSKCNSLVASAKLVKTIASENKLSDSKNLSESIVKNSSEITKYAVLSINGIDVAGESEKSVLDNALNVNLEKYQEQSGMETVEYCSTLKVEEKYIPKADASALQSAYEYISSCTLPIQSYTTVVETCAIDYGIEKTNSSDLLIGSTKTVSAGEEGVKEVTYKIAYINGVQTEKVELTSKVIKEPVAKQVLVGTKKVSSADKNSNFPMCWPIKRVAGSFVSSYMGDGRGHKGMDICAPKGTPIYAAYGGEVIFASCDSSGYGNYIIIDHKNGYKTVYAHCSELYVKKGDTVSIGEHIAAVGSTGYSTGNHVHFEVRKGDTPVNPAKFIGTN